MRELKAELKTELLADGIRNAIADLEKCERSRLYTIDMDYYHSPYYAFKDSGGRKRQCAVCLAGSVIAKELHAKSNQKLMPSCFGPETDRKLRALDAIRCGSAYAAARLWHGVKVHERTHPVTERMKRAGIYSYELTPYEVDRGAFKKQLLEIADQLEKINV